MVDKKMVFMWRVKKEANLPAEVTEELRSWYGSCDSCYQVFSWDDEDNELCPNIAEYVSDKYNEYFFIIDLS